MFAKNVLSVRARFAYLCKFASTNVTEHIFAYNPKFTAQEQAKILDVLNKSDAEQMSRFDVTKGRIKKLQSWRNKNGPFSSLPEILEVEGLGINVLERLCQSILTASPDKPPDIVQLRNFKPIATPSLSADDIKQITSAVGLHLGPTGISWAKLQRNNELECWNFYNLSKLPKSMLPSDTFNLTMQILHLIPQADVYILETFRMNQLKKLTNVASMYIHQLEMASMLMALLNMSEQHNPRLDKNSTNKCLNKVYHMRALLSARLFKTLVGNEKVSTNYVVSSLIRGSTPLSYPCEPIHVEQKLQDVFNSCSSADCDLLGQALLLVISFMNLCVYKTQSSLSGIRRGRYV